ncbi:hypothetical protein HanPI659440_Chr13g0490441 [Helianthus annuus]|nr:hypothetical protein HanPI659440_Chr13g0490441 [Helianthus annuus]
MPAKKPVLHVRRVTRASGKSVTTPVVPRSGSTASGNEAVLEEPIIVQQAAWAFDLDKKTSVQEGVVEEPLGQEKEPSMKQGAEEEVFGFDKETTGIEHDLDAVDRVDSEDNEYNVDLIGTKESSSDDDDEGFFEEGIADEVQDEAIGSESNKEDVEWRQSQDAIKQTTKNEVAATKKLVEKCIRPNEKKGKLHESNDARCAHIEGYSSYEESDGDIATPGDSEDDDVRGKKYKETAPSK